MDALEAVMLARDRLADVTPLLSDCGRVCGGACCQPDADGQGGMLLFPGEEQLYDPLPPGWRLERDDGVCEGAALLICDGTCRREARPLSCRLFPLLPSPRGCRMDRRAWAVCPLMESGKKGLDPGFVQAVKAAGQILYACPEHAAFLNALHEYNDRLSQL